jgi:eukaryotic-like serine/threonine-protein kinase
MHPGLGIDAATWLRIDPLLDAALELPPAERDAWLTTLPKQHDDVKALLRTLLGRASRIGNAALLDALPAMDTTDDGAAHAAHHSAGELIGPYRLLRELGVGGMGAVWLAERADGLMAQRHVALKLPFFAGGPFQGDLAARIAREREILATLDHPHIARLYDAGMAANGQPFMALEHVDGQRIDHHCAQHALSVHARLRLFLQVARAVAHAHAQLIVHRDLKPSNLLVDAAGQVKLLDFGIARLLDDGVLPARDLTQQGARVLTPDYAAPEQVSGQPVGTRSDVYSLGVLLFELLAGQRPYRLKRDSRAALEEAVLHAEAPRPSDVATNAATRRSLRGDLDTIVLKALKKSVTERYASVDALAEDIERYLGNRPVLARPDALRYRLRKFIVRNRFVAGTAGALLATVLGGAGTALWQARVAIDERERAEAVKDFVAGIFREAGPYEGGSKDLSAVALLKQADQRLAATFVGRSEVRVELSNTIGASLLHLGDFEAAEPVVQRAVAQAEQALPALHPQTLRAFYLRSQVHRARGRPQQARDDVDRVLPALRLRAGGPADTRTPADDSTLNLADALLQSAVTAIDLGVPAEAEAFAQECVALAQARLSERDKIRLRCEMVLAQTYRLTRKFDRALVLAEQVHRHSVALYGEATPNRSMIEAQVVYGWALADSGDLARGLALLDAVVADTRALMGPRNANVGVVLHSMVAYRMELGELAAAEANADEALDFLGQRMAPDTPAYAIAEHSRAAVHLAQHKTAAALASAQRAAAVLDQRHGPGRETAIAARTTMALALAQAGRLDAAQQEIDTLVPRAAALPPDSLQVARVQQARGTVARLCGEHMAALQQLKTLVDSTDASPKWQRERMRAWAQIGLVQLDQGTPTEAIASFERALKEFERLETKATPARAEALMGLGRAHLAQGAPTQAVALFEQAEQFWRTFDSAHPLAASARDWLARARAAERG